MDCTAQEISQSSNLLLQVKVAPIHADTFNQKYSEATGSKPHGQAFIVEKRKDGRKINCEVWFTAPERVVRNLEALGFKASYFQRGEFSYMIDSEQLFWKLVRNGFRIGQTVPVRQEGQMELASV